MEDVIVWEAPAPCPDAASVRARLRRLLGERDGSRAFGVRAHVVREGESFSLHVSVSVAGETGRRTLTETSCDVLADAAVSIVALAAHSEPPPPAPLVVTRPGPSLAPLDPAPLDRGSATIPSPRPIGRPAWRPELSAPEPTAKAGKTPTFVGLGGWVGLEAGLLPTPAPLVGFSASVEHGAWSVLARGGASGDRDIRAQGQIGARASFVTGSLGVCRAVFAGPFAPCAGLSLVRLQASGFGEAIAGRTGHAYVPRAELGGVATLTRDHLGFRAGAFVTVPVTRPPFVIGTTEEVFRPGAGGRAEVAAFLVF